MCDSDRLLAVVCECPHLSSVGPHRPWGSLSELMLSYTSQDQWMQLGATEVTRDIASSPKCGFHRTG